MEGLMGPVVGVVVAIIILGLIAGVIGRMCSGRSVMGRGNYDCQAWIEQKCSTCIDDRVDPPTQRQQHHPQPQCQPPQQQSMPDGVDEETESHVGSSEESLPELERHQAPVSLQDYELYLSCPRSLRASVAAFWQLR